MTDHNEHLGGRRGEAAVITDARMATSQEMSTRIRRYTITMAFRTACFLSMIFVEGPFRWVLLGAAVLLPYVAVMFANQAHQRHAGKPEHAEPTQYLQLTADSYEVIRGGVVDDDERNEDRDRRVA